MKKTVLVACSFLGALLWTEGYGQDKKANEKQSYEDYKRSSSQSVPALLKTAERLKEKNPQEALRAVQEALGLSLTKGDVASEGRCYILLGEINEGIQEWKLALENYARAYEKFANRKVVATEQTRALQGMGNASLRLGLYPEALNYFQQALQHSLTESDRIGRQLDISEVYYQMEKYTDALAALADIQVGGKFGNPALANRLQNQKAKINARLNNLDRSLELYDSSLNTLRQAKTVSTVEDNSLQDTKEEIADAYRSQNRYDDEIALRNKSIAYNLESKNLVEVTKDKVALGKTLEAKGDRALALKETEEAARIADTLNSNPREQAHAYLALAELYEKSGERTQALQAYKKYSFSMNQADTFNEQVLSRRADLIKIQKDIEEVTKNVSIAQREETIERATVFRQQLIIYGLLVLLAVIATTSYFIYKNAQASKRANQLLALKSLRSQMNPHFIFNALNSVNHFIARQDERAANRFLSEFSQLMRLVLENSQEDFIPLQKEQEILALYLKLEHYRFRDKFDYAIEIDESINSEAIRIPPMLIQPYIENAVWHGLRYRETMGTLTLRFLKENGGLMVRVTDDGIGRKRSAELKTTHQKKHNSTGLKNIQERLDILNNVYKTRYRVTIHDLPADGGTDVHIYLPLDNGKHNV